MYNNKITWVCHIIAMGVITALLVIINVQDRMASELRSKVSELEKVVQKQQFLIAEYSNKETPLVGKNNE